MASTRPIPVATLTTVDVALQPSMQIPETTHLRPWPCIAPESPSGAAASATVATAVGAAPAPPSATAKERRRSLQQLLEGGRAPRIVTIHKDADTNTYGFFLRGTNVAVCA